MQCRIALIPITYLALLAGCRADRTPTAPRMAATPPRTTRGSEAASAVGIREVATRFTSPVVLVHSNDGSGRLFVADQVGEIRVIDAKGNLSPEPGFLYISIGAGGGANDRGDKNNGFGRVASWYA
ncbi:MAG: hypothetical protein NVS4B3_28670 [Gemmatimonadaceae bacterium]